jgi:hypothetical protein
MGLRDYGSWEKGKWNEGCLTSAFKKSAKHGKDKWFIMHDVEIKGVSLSVAGLWVTRHRHLWDEEWIGLSQRDSHNIEND